MDFLGLKIQDVFFVILLITLLRLRKKELFVLVSLSLLLLAMPLFHFQIFFTAQRMVQYSFGLLVIGSIWYAVSLGKEKEKIKK